jgi:hypothetical protein
MRVGAPDLLYFSQTNKIVTMNAIPSPMNSLLRSFTFIALDGRSVDAHRICTPLVGGKRE